MRNVKLKRLEKILKKLGRVAVAFSGGADSTFLLKVARDLLGPRNVIAVTSSAEIFSRSDIGRAKELAKSIGARHIIFKSGILSDPKFTSNSARRCYYCKRRLFSDMKDMAKKEGFDFIVDGSNFDDMKDYRPGNQALEEKHVLSPLKQARITKNDIKDFSKKLRLSTWDKPANACLASRIAYHEAISRKKLRVVEALEEILKNEFNFRQVRARFCGDIIRIEVFPEEIHKFFKDKIRMDILGRLKVFGFKYVTVDLKGYRCGSMNEGLPRRSKP
ncbi:MAG: ATP-dependent sacrificial sulfur transferase LarE [Candidatus Omnitrophota bacterium]